MSLQVENQQQGESEIHGDYEVVGGAKVGHGAIPWILMSLFIMYMVWASISWIAPPETIPGPDKPVSSGH